MQILDLGMVALAPWGLALGLACVLQPELALGFLAFNLGVFPKDQRLLDLGVSLTMDRLLLGLLLLGLLLRRASRGGERGLEPASPAFALIPLLLVALLGVAHSLRPLEALLQQLYNLGLGLVLLWSCHELLPDFERRRRMACVLCWSAAYVAALGHWETWSGRYIFPAEALHWRGGLLRSASVLGNPVPYGAYLACVAPVAWGLARTARSWAGRAMMGLGWALIVAGVLLSFSRQAYLALALGSVAGWALEKGFARLMLGLGGGSLLLFLSSSAWLGPVASVFFDWNAVSNILHRLYMSDVALRLMLEHPLLGVGLGSFRELAFRVEPLNAISTPHYGEFPSAHNSYLTLGAELGLPGLALFLLLLALGLARLARRGLDGSLAREERALGRAMFGGLVAYAVGALFLDAHEYLLLSSISFFWMGLAGSSSWPRPASAK